MVDYFKNKSPGNKIFPFKMVNKPADIHVEKTDSDLLALKS